MYRDFHHGASSCKLLALHQVALEVSVVLITTTVELSEQRREGTLTVTPTCGVILSSLPPALLTAGSDTCG